MQGHQESCGCCCAGVSPEDAKLLTMSTLTEQGVMDVKQIACDRLLASRVEAKLQVRLNVTLLYKGPVSGALTARQTLRFQLENTLLQGTLSSALSATLLC